VALFTNDVIVWSVYRISEHVIPPRMRGSSNSLIPGGLDFRFRGHDEPNQNLLDLALSISLWAINPGGAS